MPFARKRHTEIAGNMCCMQMPKTGVIVASLTEIEKKLLKTHLAAQKRQKFCWLVQQQVPAG